MDTENMKTLVEQNGSQSAAVLGELVDDELFKQNGNQAGSALGELADSDLLAQNGDQAAAGFGEVYDEVVGGKELVSIDAVFTQGAHAVYPNTSLNTLKQWLVVTATYDDESTKVLSASEYSLSGTLSVGNSTITASYQGKTDTFTVVVSAITYDYYLGYFNDRGWSSNSDFAALTKEQLVGMATGYMKTSQASITKTIAAADTEATDPDSRREILFLMWKSGSAPQGGSMNLGLGVETLTAGDIDGTASEPKFKTSSHDAVTIDGVEYTISGLRAKFEIGNFVTISF